MRQFLAGEKVYLAGPMSGIPEFNFPAFARYNQLLTEAGLVVVDPAQHDLENGHTVEEIAKKGPEFRHEMLAWDFDQIINEVQGVVLMPGWHESKGARAEAMLAQMIGKSVFLIVESENELGLAPLIHSVETYVGVGVGGRPHRG
jgi:hypothetical protein